MERQNSNKPRQQPTHQQPARRKKKKNNRAIRILGFSLGTITNIVLFLFTVFIAYQIAFMAFDSGKKYGEAATEEKESQEVVVEIPDGASLKEVSQYLEKVGLVPNAFIYELEHLLKGNDDPFVGGSYTLNMNMDSSEINAKLREANIIPANEISITILEGWNIKEIGEYLESKDIVTADDFLAACDPQKYSYAFLADIPDRENPLEGYLFPDTYFIIETSDAETIINKMLTRFEEIYFGEEYNLSRKAEELNLTMDEAVTIASIIEKEINRDEERAKASSVIYNRLERDIPLQMCSTILYVLGKRKDRLLDEDLQIESPYNTYINKGLPVGPIGNPGKQCLEAALSPDNSDLLYFVVKDETTGEHVFTNNYDEFVNAKAQYNQKF